MSRAPVIFDEVLLDEPSDSATNSGELPRIDGKPAPPEVILQLTPEFARCREERRRALEADRAARAAAAAPIDQLLPSGNGMSASESLVGRGFNRDINDGSPSSSSPPQATRQGTASAVPTPQEQQSVASSPSLLPPAALEEPARSAERSASRATDRNSLVGRGGTCPDRSVGNRDINDGSPSTPLLPQAAFPTSASCALPHHAANENNVADAKQSVAMPPSSLPPAALDKPETAKQSARAAGPPLGSSGSANPPFPFTPEPLRRWKPRRRF